LNGYGSLLEAVDHFVRFAARRETVRTVSEVVEDFIAAKSADGLSEVYVNDLTWRLRRFAAAFPKSISTITSGEIDGWLRGLSTSHRTRNNFRNLIISLFNFAKRRGHVARDRETEAQYTERAKAKPGAIEIFTPTELAEMLSVAEGQPKLALALGAFTGIRSAELLRVHWENFNWEESVVDLGTDQTKTASRRLVPILPVLKEWIAPYVKPRDRVLNYRLPVCLAEAFATIAKKVTMARGDGAPVFKWKTNALRHSFASYRVAMTQDVPSVALELGNSPQKVFSNYRRVVTRSQAEAWFAVRPSPQPAFSGLHDSARHHSFRFVLPNANPQNLALA
jgi:integrase